LQAFFSPILSAAYNSETVYISYNVRQTDVVPPIINLRSPLRTTFAARMQCTHCIRAAVVEV